MNATFHFQREQDAEDCHIMFTAFGWPHTLVTDMRLPNHRIVAEYVPDEFGRMAGEAGVFAPVQITVE